MSEPGNQYDGEILEADDVGVRRPRKYSVIMHNDDYTTMEFVVLVLISIFGHSRENATRLMKDIHEKGSAVAGIYSFEIAETKVVQTMKMARNEGYPLKCTLKAE